jgi:hypothetical protein
VKDIGGGRIIKFHSSLIFFVPQNDMPLYSLEELYFIPRL